MRTQKGNEKFLDWLGRVFWLAMALVATFVYFVFRACGKDLEVTRVFVEANQNAFLFVVVVLVMLAIVIQLPPKR